MSCIKQGKPTANPLYRPDVQQVTPEMRSPDFVQISTAAAITLGLMPGVMYRDACTHCLNLLLTYPEGCRANCSYCGLARHREENRDYADRNFIRVDWPSVSLADLLDCMQAATDQGRIERMCISMITHPRSNRDTVDILKAWVARVPDIPVSILSNPTTMTYHDLVELNECGAEIFTVALDAATEEIFERTRGRTVDSPHRWSHYWQALEWAAEIFGPERFGAHVICGMGESEYECLQVVQRIRDMGGHSHMFAFFPEQGSLMQDWSAVPQGQWRRIQLARFLIDFRDVRLEQMRFDAQGRVREFGVSSQVLEALITSGKPFQTSGCPSKGDVEISSCNRPFGDSPPSNIRSYPFRPNDSDVKKIRIQAEVLRVATSSETHCEPTDFPVDE